MSMTESSLNTVDQTQQSASSTSPEIAPVAVTSSSVTVSRTDTSAPTADKPSAIQRLFANISSNFVLYAEVLLVLYLVVEAVTFNNPLAKSWVEQVAFVVMAHQSSPAASGKGTVVKVPNAE